MAKILFLVIASIVIVLIARWLRVGNRSGPVGGSPHGFNSFEPEVMVPCSACGVHVPRREAFGDGPSFFCCEDHAQHGSPRV